MDKRTEKYFYALNDLYNFMMVKPRSKSDLYGFCKDYKISHTTSSYLQRLGHLEQVGLNEYKWSAERPTWKWVKEFIEQMRKYERAANKRYQLKKEKNWQSNNKKRPETYVDMNTWEYKNIKPSKKMLEDKPQKTYKEYGVEVKYFEASFLGIKIKLKPVYAFKHYPEIQK